MLRIPLVIPVLVIPALVIPFGKTWHLQKSFRHKGTKPPKQCVPTGEELSFLSIVSKKLLLSFDLMVGQN